MAITSRAACTFYVAALLVLTAAIHIGAAPAMTPGRPLVSPLERGAARGEISPGVPLLDRDDPMANAALLMAALDDVRPPVVQSGTGVPCHAAPRSFALLVEGRLSRVRFGARAVCQLQRLKQISVAQPGFGKRGLGEVAAFILGRRIPQGSDVDVTRVVVPPFRFGGDTLTFVSADLGPLQQAEQLIGTYHTHPEGDIEQGVLSDIDLRYMFTGNVDFHGQVGPLREPGRGLDWLFDIVEPRDGDWNVYVHDRQRLQEMLRRCDTEAVCPLNELRLAGSRYYLLTRYYEERDSDL